jgi:uncharacterized membrane protein
MKEYLMSTRAVWYWIIVIGAIMAELFITSIPNNLYPWFYAREAFGLLLVFYLPGYAFTRLLWRSNEQKSSSTTLDNIIKFILSVCMSIAIAIIDGVLFYYSPLGLNSTAIALSITLLTIAVASITIFNEFNSKI